MENIVKVISINENVEEEAVIEINNIEIVTFIGYSPYPIELNEEYPVEISFFVDEADIKENNEEERKLVRRGKTFEYDVKGYLDSDGKLDIGFLIEDDLFGDYQHLYGKYIALKVNRINSEFV